MRHLRMVVAVAESGSVTKAAAALGIAQPALTAQLNRIDRSLGGNVFVRDRFGARPTELGELILRHARVLLPAMGALADDAERLVNGDVRQGGDGPGGHHRHRAGRPLRQPAAHRDTRRPGHHGHATSRGRRRVPARAGHHRRRAGRDVLGRLPAVRRRGRVDPGLHRPDVRPASTSTTRTRASPRSRSPSCPRSSGSACRRTAASRSASCRRACARGSRRVAWARRSGPPPSTRCGRGAPSRSWSQGSWTRRAS